MRTALLPTYVFWWLPPGVNTGGVGRYTPFAGGKDWKQNTQETKPGQELSSLMLMMPLIMCA